MKPLTLKFYTVGIMHVLLFVLFCGLAQVIPFIELSRKDLVFNGLFSVVYFLLVWSELYSKPYHHYLRNAKILTFRSLIVCAALLLGIEYFYGMVTNRHTIPLATIINDLSLLTFYFFTHFIQYFWIVHLANLGFFRKNVMLVGSYDERIPVEQLFQNINNTKNFIGQIIIKDGEWHYKRDLDAEPVRITKTISNFLFSKAVNELIICMDTDITSSALQECADWCYENSIGYYLIPDIAKLPHAFPWGKRFAIIPSIERYCPNRDSLIMISFKRIFDIVASAGALVVLSPVFLVLSILIRLGDGGKVFYVSKRVGIHGKLMNFYKFRSMVPNAEELKKDLLDRNERPDGPLFKLTNDPRVTKVGRFLRKSSLDELPQFWNVLKGDMSIIGPRPQLPHEVAEYDDEDNLRLECIPGISCLPQIYGRNTLGFRDWINLDLEYRKNWSLTYDFLILFKTAKVVLKPVFAHFSR